MTDKELLELAAKAAGYTISEWSNSYGFCCYDKADEFWNPLTDDGDALRLAVKLDVLVHVFDKYTVATDGRYADIFEMHHGDKYAATRRAIVRAAAEIGKTL
jgi:hypothetical protein